MACFTPTFNTQRDCGRRAYHSKTARETTDLHHNVPQLLLHLLLRTQESLPQVVAHASPLQQCAARLLRRPDLDDAVDVLDGPPQQCRPQHAVRDLGSLLLLAVAAGRLGLEMKERQVDVTLQMRREPGGKVRTLGWRQKYSY